MHKKDVIILAIETSCDETAASVLRGTIGAKNPTFTTLSSVVKSQMQLHVKMGGVVPEANARAHVRSIRPVVEKALGDANLQIPFESTNELRINESLKQIDYIAVTAGPGLIASLLVGVEFAKALAFATGKPMIAVNHMEGHLYSPFGAVDSKAQISNDKQILNAKIQKTKPIQFPILSMIVSGGHTLLVLQKNESHYQVLGSTVDDAAGEAFDKVAKLLELPYPGGPEISKLAEHAVPRTDSSGSGTGGEAVISFPRPMIHAPNFDFSFSGLKTAVLYHLKETYPNIPTAPKGKAVRPIPLLSKERLGEVKTNLHSYHFGHIPKTDKANIARSFEEAVVDVLVTKAMRAAKKYDCKTISLAGGVAANKRLRAVLSTKCEMQNIKFIVPDFKLCTDNAEMIALAAYFKLRAGYKPVSFDKVTTNSGWEL